MTLILAMANRQQVVLVSDRRLTHDGHVVDVEGEFKDESNKAAVFVCKNARLAVAYTGLAREGNFLTKHWLPVAIAESAAPDFLMSSTIERFRQRATHDFANIRARTSSSKRFSVVFAGYCYDEIHPRCYCWLVSNYDGLDGEPPRSDASDEFSVQFLRDIWSSEQELHLLVALGAHQAISESDYRSLQTLLLQNKPVQALVGKGVKVIRTAANSSQSIGKQCTSIILPSDPNEHSLGEYHSAKPTPQTYSPSFISARGDGSGVYVISDPSVEARDANDQPRIISIPKVGRNHLCPCDSGLKYKLCHGRHDRNQQKSHIEF